MLSAIAYKLIKPFWAMYIVEKYSQSFKFNLRAIAGFAKLLVPFIA
jgi:hypothetical protein